MPTPAELLADVPLFALLDDGERSALAARLESVELPAGAVIFREGEPGDSFYVVRSGEVEISVTTDAGERLVLETARRGDFFGELSLLDGGPRTAVATATTAVEALTLDRDALDEFLRLKPAAAMDLLGASARHLRENVRLLHRAVSRNVSAHMAEKASPVMRAVDAIAAEAGSLSFLVVHLVLFAAWILLNLKPLDSTPLGGFDPFPFGLLTLCVSLEAIVLSCLLLLSQNRLAAHDRMRDEIEYEVNLKAELEVAQLHEKVDAMNADLLHRMDRLARALAQGHESPAATRTVPSESTPSGPSPSSLRPPTR